MTEFRVGDRVQVHSKTWDWIGTGTITSPVKSNHMGLWHEVELDEVVKGRRLWSVFVKQISKLSWLQVGSV